MEDHDDNAPKPVQSVSHSVFRVLEAESEAHTASQKAGDEQENSANTDEGTLSSARVTSDFASDFADPSLLYHPPTETKTVETASEDNSVDETPEEEPASLDLGGYQVLEADEAYSEEPEPEPEIVGPGLVAKPIGGKPILCLMGEFSAGKSTLTNLLIGTAALPVNVTATQLPPVWISKGNDAPYRVGPDGQEFDIELERLEEVSVDDTAYIRIFHDSALLDHCDLIDMPGISDPNMDAEVWQRVIHYADAVIWCSHATQAWRQSEAAVWSMLPPELYAKSFLLLTRMDKILSDRDQMRVVKRVGRETVGLFKEIFPISLTRALAADDDVEKLQASGAADFSEALQALLEEIAAEKVGDAAENLAVDPDEPAKFVLPSRIQPKPLLARRSNSRPAPEPLPPF